MGVVKTNNFSLAYAIEDSLGVLTSTIWKLLEPNDIGAWGGQLTTTPRDPISNRRQRRKGVSTDLESNVEFDHDWTLEAFIDFAEAFVFAVFKGGPSQAPTSCDTDSSLCTNSKKRHSLYEDFINPGPRFLCTSIAASTIIAELSFSFTIYIPCIFCELYG